MRTMCSLETGPPLLCVSPLLLLALSSSTGWELIATDSVLFHIDLGRTPATEKRYSY